ncbi:hypothetical protein BRADI_5g27699v3 [Brachypodium distachyon]|uniref:Uncharacterized protein n=1 Tax=Brachypodium distachyon TaxID=15368 RepID=A0A0Q3IH16_BRADI|nr:hypothetical protein BRADI_5g27699v3 [Brachypodium distachyon]
MGALLHAFSGNVEEALRRVIVDPAATCLVTDTFFVWPATLARKLGIAYVSFWTELVLIFNLYYHVHLLTNNGHFGCNEPRNDTITYIPCVAAIEPQELMSYLQETDTTSVVHRIIFKAFDEARGSDYVLCNTVEELEPSTIAQRGFATCRKGPRAYLNHSFVRDSRKVSLVNGHGMFAFSTLGKRRIHLQYRFSTVLTLER